MAAAGTANGLNSTTAVDAAGDDKENIELAAAKLVTILNRREKGTLDVEKASVFGSALAIPQIARSAGWPREMWMVVVRSYTFLLVTFVMQLSILYLINKETLIWNKFAGEMYLCNFGANMADCPDGPGCIGPGGGLYTPTALYNFAGWTNRMFVADSLSAVFPKEYDKVYDEVRPGEFGVQSHTCRFLACFLFTISTIPEFVGCWNLMYLLIMVPTEDESWLDYETPSWSSSKDRAMRIRGWSEIDLVTLKIAGMSCRWKIANFFLLLVPKVVILLLTILAGSMFLMETSGIDNIIVNSTALAFILNIDEMIFSSMVSRATRHMLDQMAGFPLYDTEIDETLTDEQVKALYRKGHEVSPLYQVMSGFPMRLVVAIVVTLLSIFVYYYNNCIYDKDGVLVSKSMHLPESVGLSLWQSLLPDVFPAPTQAEPYWQMPEQAYVPHHHRGGPEA